MFSPSVSGCSVLWKTISFCELPIFSSGWSSGQYSKEDPKNLFAEHADLKCILQKHADLDFVFPLLMKFILKRGHLLEEETEQLPWHHSTYPSCDSWSDCENFRVREKLKDKFTSQWIRTLSGSNIQVLSYILLRVAGRKNSALTVRKRYGMSQNICAARPITRQGKTQWSGSTASGQLPCR